jgi:hypothetical protein
MDRSLDPKDMLRTLSIGRLGFGALGLLAPRRSARMLLGTQAGPWAGFAVRAWAAREIAVAMATLHELERDEPNPRVLELNAFVDGVDAVAAVISRGMPFRSRVATLGAAAAAVAVAVQAVREMQDA